MRELFIAAFVGVALFGGLEEAVAQERGQGLTDLPELHAACREAREDGDRRLYFLTLEPSGYSFAAHRPVEGVLWVNTRQNLRALGGAVQLFPSGREPIGFHVSAARAELLRQASEAGAVLRLGFFLGLERRSGTLCLMRPAMGVTTARIDLAYAELVGTDGEVLVREEHDRLAAFLAYAESQRVPGEGPRAVLGEATALTGVSSVPAEWQAALRRANTGLSSQLSACYVAALGRGAAPEGQVVVRLRVQAANGRIDQSGVELSTLGDAAGATCLADTLERGLALPPLRAPVISADIRVPLRLAAD